jgi:hypothetical protein
MKEVLMKRKYFYRLILFFFVVTLAFPLFAQEQTGSIKGRIVDQEGAPLPGASVTLHGSALMGTRTFVSSESGNFRFSAVPPGRDYVMRFPRPLTSRIRNTPLFTQLK